MDQDWSKFDRTRRGDRGGRWPGLPESGDRAGEAASVLARCQRLRGDAELAWLTRRSSSTAGMLVPTGPAIGRVVAATLMRAGGCVRAVRRGERTVART